MLCRELREMIERTLPEERTPEQVAAATEHAKECPSCDAYLSEISALEKSLRELPPVPAGPGVKQAVMARVLRGAKRPSAQKRESRFAWAWSASLVSALFLSCLPYWILLRSGGWLQRSWTFHWQLSEHLGFGFLGQPWTMAVPCAAAACLIAVALMWHDSRA